MSELQLFDTAPPVPPHRVEFVAGVLAQAAWGDGKRTPKQVAASVAAAEEALAKLGAVGDA